MLHLFLPCSITVTLFTTTTAPLREEERGGKLVIIFRYKTWHVHCNRAILFIIHSFNQSFNHSIR